MYGGDAEEEGELVITTLGRRLAIDLASHQSKAGKRSEYEVVEPAKLL